MSRQARLYGECWLILLVGDLTSKFFGIGEADHLFQVGNGLLTLQS